MQADFGDAAMDSDESLAAAVDKLQLEARARVEGFRIDEVTMSFPEAGVVLWRGLYGHQLRWPLPCVAVAARGGAQLGVDNVVPIVVGVHRCTSGADRGHLALARLPIGVVVRICGAGGSGLR